MSHIYIYIYTYHINHHQTSHRKTYNLPPSVSLSSERGFSGLLEASTKRPRSTGNSENRWKGGVKRKKKREEFMGFYEVINGILW